MIRLSRVFPALCLALPIWAQPPEVRTEKGPMARLNHVSIQKPETNSYLNATVAVSTIETHSGTRCFLDIWISEGSYTFPYLTMWANINALVPLDVLKLTGKTALLEYDFTGNPDVEVSAYEYDVTGYVANIPYQPGHLRLKFVENGYQGGHTIGNGIYHIQNLEMRWSGQYTGASASVTEGVIFGTTVPATDNATMGTNHFTNVQRTRKPGPVKSGPGAPPANGG